MFADKLGKPADSDKDFANAGTALGTMIARVGCFFRVMGATGFTFD